MLRRIFGPKREEVLGGWMRVHSDVKVQGKGKGKVVPVLI
jgi:hypothetical protein